MWTGIWIYEKMASFLINILGLTVLLLEIFKPKIDNFDGFLLFDIGIFDLLIKSNIIDVICSMLEISKSIGETAKMFYNPPLSSISKKIKIKTITPKKPIKKQKKQENEDDTRLSGRKRKKPLIYDPSNHLKFRKYFEDVISSIFNLNLYSS